MNSYNLGLVIRTVRKQRGFSQQILAQDICSREQLIRIEHGRFYPSLYTISLLSSKLGVDLYKYFEFLEYSNPIDVQSYFHRFEELHMLRDYKGLQLLLEEYKTKYTFNKIHQPLIHWYHCMIDAYVNDNILENYHLLLSSLLKKYKCNNDINKLYNKFLQPIDYKIVNTIIIFQFCLGNLDIGVIMLTKTLNNLLYKYNLIEPDVLMPMIFNLAKALFRQENYEGCIEYCKLGLKILIEKNSTKLMGDLYAQMADAYESLGDKSMAIKYYNYFITFFEMNMQQAEIVELKKALNNQYDNIFI